MTVLITERSAVFRISQEEKRRMKEEIERRRAEAAEKRQQMGVETVDGEAKPFKCFSPRGSSLKVSQQLLTFDLCHLPLCCLFMTMFEYCHIDLTLSSI